MSETMNEHELKLSMKELDVAKGGVEFNVCLREDKSDHTSRREKIGTLKVSNGSITWYSSNVSDKNRYNLKWEEFDLLMSNAKKAIAAIKKVK